MPLKLDNIPLTWFVHLVCSITTDHRAKPPNGVSAIDPPEIVQLSVIALGNLQSERAPRATETLRNDFLMFVIVFHRKGAGPVFLK